MRVTVMVVASVAVLASLACAQVPGEFALYQSDPDPFCPDDPPGAVTIRYDLPQQCYVLLEIWNPDATEVVRSVALGTQATGLYSVIWDGRSDSGEVVEDGVYPYTLTASEFQGGPVLFEDTLFSTINCGAPVEETNWGRIKALFE
jgi:hypothetical protein